MTERDMDHMSRAFSRVLRYDAAKMGLAVEDGGFVRVLQLLEHFENYTFQDVRNLVSWSVHGRDGARFELRETPSGHLIRSTRGHTDVRRASSRPSSAHMSDEDMPARRHQDLPRRERSLRRAPWRRESNGEPFSLSLSKGMAKLLRHTDHEDMSPNGWLAMRTLIQMLSHGRTPVTAEDIRRVAEFNKYSEDRPRYEVHVAGRDEWVRAVRGHTVL
ncbi:unnamed protein product [Prorocentrum cordatum]|uniref:2'-phosphotransferase n=1 Tax=Prorocentrum cordatum TaxID=2364126 RepID=A0ABN9PPX9_9DINO|nr:unnamed protein product [Polarella glacialis]